MYFENFGNNFCVGRNCINVFVNVYKSLNGPVAIIGRNILFKSVRKLVKFYLEVRFIVVFLYYVHYANRLAEKCRNAEMSMIACSIELSL